MDPDHSVETLQIQGQVACAVFDGSIRVADIELGRQICQLNSQCGRVWSVRELSPGVVMSAADDGVVRVWDLRSRERKPIMALAKQPGRVSGLLRLGDNTVISSPALTGPPSNTVPA